MDKFRLDNKTALVTGGSKGIGFGIAKALAEAGSDLALVARDTNTLHEARDQLSADGKKPYVYSYDMSQTDGISNLYDQINDETGGIDILVNNAGGTRRGPADTLTSEDWKLVINLNMTATFTLYQAFARDRIKRNQGGKIINIASLMSQTVREDNAPYAASKGGIRQLTKALAVDWAKHAINVNAIGPGFIQTDLTQPLWQDDDFNKWVNWKTPWARWGTPEDIGNAAVYLASAASDFVTGHILYVDGGLLSTFGPSSW